MAENIESVTPLLQLLMDQGIVNPGQCAELEQEAKASGKTVRNLLVDKGMIMEDQLIEVIAGYLGTYVVNLPAADIPSDVVRALPASVARMYNTVPLEMTQNTIQLAIYDLITPEIMDEIRFVLTMDATFVLAREDDIKVRINQFYGDQSTTVTEMLSHLELEMNQVGDVLGLAEKGDEKGIEEAAGSTPVIRFVNLVLYQGVNDRASDIHFEPFEKEFKIRYRVDGALYEMAPPPKRLAMPIISRIKVMSGLNIAERRLPQDGRIQIHVGGRQIDLRVSTLPTQFGESVVLRILDRKVVSLDLENLGMPEDVYQFIIRDVEKPNGIFIVTGPTGSGKTTTLYSALRRINKVETKILTAEEPVEYDIEGLIQVPIHENVGNTFANILRSFLRQDPDAMMIGEIRDLETAQIAVQASLTGHLVFSTLHTNDACGAVTRLIDMDVEPFLISSTLEAVLGQRLVRSVCLGCKRPFKPDQEVMRTLGVTEKDVEGRDFYYGTGCPQCNQTGYKGRKGIYEYLTVSDPIRQMINEKKPTLLIRDKAIEMGMRTLREDGIKNVLDGYTTVEEVIKYT